MAVGYRALIQVLATTALGTLFALVTGSSAAAQFDDEFNVKFRANRLMNWLARPDHKRVPVSVRYLDTKT